MTSMPTPTLPDELELRRAAQELIDAVHDHPSTLGVVTAGLQAFERHLAHAMPADKHDVIRAASAFQTALILEMVGVMERTASR